MWLPSLLELTVFVTDADTSAALYRALGITLFDADEPGGPRTVDGLLGADTRPIISLQSGFRVTQVTTVATHLDRRG